MNKKKIIPSEMSEKYTKWHFSPAIESEDFLFVSGCTGTRLDGTNSSDVKEQFRQAFETVEIILTKAGLSFSDVVEMTSFHINLREHFRKFMLVKDEFIGEPYPAWTAVGVSELAADDAMIEIKVIAKKTDLEAQRQS